MPIASIPYRSVTHGTCALNGAHAPGSKYARECPLRPGGLVDRQRAAGKASAKARRRRRGGPSPAPLVENPGAE